MQDYERMGMWANLGARLARFEPGDVVVEARLTAEAHGFPAARGTIVHGGAIAALADMALASAGATLLSEGETLATVDLRIDYMRPGRPGTMLARGHVRRRTRRLCFVSGSIEQGDGTVVAEARALLAYAAT